MQKEIFEKNTIITAERGCYLKLKSKKDSEKLIGKPVRIIFDNTDTIPEFIEQTL